MFFKSQFMFVLFAIFLVCAEESDVNYENLRRFMSQSPEDLAKTLQLLENPYIAAALVNGDKKQRLQPNTPPMEESNNLLNFLLSQRGAPGNSNTKYKVEKPPLPFVPPVVHAKEIENDPLLGSFFQNTMEDQAPLENAKNTDIPTIPNRQSQRQVKAEQYQQSVPVFEQYITYYYLPPLYFN